MINLAAKCSFPLREITYLVGVSSKIDLQSYFDAVDKKMQIL